MEEMIFTSGAILNLLSEIDELKDYDIDVSESSQGVIISIGDSTYAIQAKDATPIEVDEDVIDTVSDVSDEAYSDYDESELDEVEGGIVKEAIKNMFLGGMIRLTNKMLAKDRR